MFLDHQIIILEGFLKDHVTLKTGVMMLKILIQIVSFKILIQKHIIQIENSYCTFCYTI